MSSSYSTNLKIELVATGEQVGVWGDTTNLNFVNVFEEALVGRGNPVFTSDANLTISLVNSVNSQTARNLYLNVTSSVSLTATRDLIVPTSNKTYVVENNTTGGQSVRIITAAGTGITIPNGRTMAVYVDGTDVVAASDYVILAGGTVGGSNIVTETGTQTLTNKTLTAPVMTAPVLGTPASGTLTNTTGFPVANLAGAGSGVLTFLATPSSANLAAAVTGETGSGALVFGTSPTIATPAISNPTMTGGGSLAGTYSGTPTFSGNVTFSSTGAITAPTGTTAQRPSATTGMLRFNSSATAFEGYNGTSWTSLGGATGGTGNPVFYENDITVTADYTITTSKNAGSFGPITVDSGVTVTVPDGSTWTIV
jgi:hypothetical protein